MADDNDCPCCNLPEWLEIFVRFLHSVSKSKLFCHQANPNLCLSAQMEPLVVCTENEVCRRGHLFCRAGWKQYVQDVLLRAWWKSVQERQKKKKHVLNPEAPFFVSALSETDGHPVDLYPVSNLNPWAPVFHG
ncbi:uncharacterized protein LOC124551311 [Schistocerca americana]|uniref:uncharacterized protein LOC124551311 n=1 Tax=Schistocerca americana TaxID=7009 RepID=UPI001F4F64A8|nr:uncharacterized protein LOC124551311 [Schistocerca americana]